jgi:hypothetical protein
MDIQFAICFLNRHLYHECGFVHLSCLSSPFIQWTVSPSLSHTYTHTFMPGICICMSNTISFSKRYTTGGSIKLCCSHSLYLRRKGVWLIYKVRWDWKKDVVGLGSIYVCMHARIIFVYLERHLMHKSRGPCAYVITLHVIGRSSPATSFRCKQDPMHFYSSMSMRICNLNGLDWIYYLIIVS